MSKITFIFLLLSLSLSSFSSLAGEIKKTLTCEDRKENLNKHQAKMNKEYTLNQAAQLYDKEQKLIEQWNFYCVKTNKSNRFDDSILKERVEKQGRFETNKPQFFAKPSIRIKRKQSFFEGEKEVAWLKFYKPAKRCLNMDQSSFDKRLCSSDKKAKMDKFNKFWQTQLEEKNMRH